MLPYLTDLWFFDFRGLEVLCSVLNFSRAFDFLLFDYSCLVSSQIVVDGAIPLLCLIIVVFLSDMFYLLLNSYVLLTTFSATILTLFNLTLHSSTILLKSVTPFGSSLQLSDCIFADLTRILQ